MPLIFGAAFFAACGRCLHRAGRPHRRAARTLFRAIDYSAVLATAQAARRAGATRCRCGERDGAPTRSRAFSTAASKVKWNGSAGPTFSTLVIARPSVLAGNRQPLHQTPRRGESLSLGAPAVAAPAHPPPITVPWLRAMWHMHWCTLCGMAPRVCKCCQVVRCNPANRALAGTARCPPTRR